jgi:cytochrome b subunit of formate dehydrogenase
MKAMTGGQVSPAWARTHHRLWYENIRRGRNGD